MTVRQQLKDLCAGNERALAAEFRRHGISRAIIEEDLPDVRRKFSYDPITGKVWFIRGRESGKEARNNGNGYITVPMWEQNHPAHRVGWLLTYGRLPAFGSGLEIDHINGDKADNRLVNLRECTHAQNIMNAKTRCDNALGIKGVYFSRVEKRYIVSIRDSGKTRRIGAFDDLDSAVAARAAASAEVYGQYGRLA